MNARPSKARGFRDAFVWGAAGLVGLVIVGGLTVFIFGEALFGSDPGTIDNYNKSVLESCPRPEGSTLVTVYVTQGVGSATGGFRLRSRIEVFASPLPPEAVRDFFEGNPVGSWSRVSPNRDCKFGNRPGVLVFSDQISGLPEILQVVEVETPPPGTQSFFALSLGQRETEGVLD